MGEWETVIAPSNVRVAADFQFSDGESLSRNFSSVERAICSLVRNRREREKRHALRERTTSARKRSEYTLRDKHP